jgi:hypothetical protein
MKTPRWALLPLLLFPLTSARGGIGLPEEPIQTNSQPRTNIVHPIPGKPATAAGTENTTNYHAVASLIDGSRIVGALSTKTMQLKTSYAIMTIGWEKVAAVDFEPDKQTQAVHLRNGDLLQGQIRLKALSMDTGFGHVSIPAELLKSLKIEIGEAATAADGLVLYWTCDHLEADRLPDSSPNKNDGMVYGSLHQVDGKIDGAIQCNGRNDFVLVPFNESFNFPPEGQFTLALWVNPKLEHRCQAVLVKGASEYWDWGLFINANGTFFSGSPGPDGFALVSRTIAQSGRWYHVVVTYNNRAWAMYVNGHAETRDTGSQITQSQGGLTLSRKGETDGSPDFCPGFFDEVRIYNRALEAEEVEALYNAVDVDSPRPHGAPRE